jgi:hypothetical protein
VTVRTGLGEEIYTSSLVKECTEPGYEDASGDVLEDLIEAMENWKTVTATTINHTSPDHALFIAASHYRFLNGPDLINYAFYIFDR